MRPVLARLVNHTTVAKLWQPGAHCALTLLEFLADVDARLAVLGMALAAAYNAAAVTAETALEAVRASDGLLRAWCESAQTGT